MSSAVSPLLEVKNLHIISKIGQFGQAPEVKELVHDVSFSVHQGRVLGIVGESGSGKSLTAKALMGIFAAGIHMTQGRVFLRGAELPVQNTKGNTKAMEAVRGKGISMLFQDPLSSFNPLHRVGRQIMEALTTHAERTAPISAPKAREKAASLLQSLGIDDAERILRAFPHQLSGGQRQRAMLAMSLINDPDILIADEPTTALDAAIQLQVVELLRSLKHKVTLIIISHDLNMMRRIADDICVMQDGRIVEEGAAERVFAQPQHPYSQMLLARPADDLPVPLQENASVLLDVHDLSVNYPLPRAWFWQKRAFFCAVNKATLTLKHGECLGIVGESGSGKSSFGLAVARLLASEGQIVFAGEDLQRQKTKDLRRTRKALQIVFQDPLAALNPRLSVQQSIAEGIRQAHKLSERELDEKVIAAMQSVELDPDIRHRYPHEFSGGQCQRICIARALIMEPQCIIFDEPTSSLDRNTQFQITQLIKDIQKKFHLACIFITHDLSLVRSLCHCVMVMQGGNIVEYGAGKDIFSHPAQDYTKMLMEAAHLL